MGEVWQARDTKLDRDVALKVLPEAFTSDPDRLARFEREAKVLASLNHPNIGSIYGLEEAEGVRALVLELVEGPTLADRIKQGPIPIDEALPSAKQIAAAPGGGARARRHSPRSEARDIKVRGDGTVKGARLRLAKAFQPDASDPNLSQSPTISLTAAATQMGMVIGTVPYMAPEQASGKVVDKRADVWAFGVVLYEMLTGARPFVGDDVSKTLAHVIAIDPDWATLPSDLPPVLGTFLRGCLEKDPNQRVRDIGDVRLAMKGSFEPAPPNQSITPPLRVWQRPVPGARCRAVRGRHDRPRSLEPQTGRPACRDKVRVRPPGEPSAPRRQSRDPGVSPDGRRFVYNTTDGLYLRCRSTRWTPGCFRDRGRRQEPRLLAGWAVACIRQPSRSSAGAARAQRRGRLSWSARRTICSV